MFTKFDPKFSFQKYIQAYDKYAAEGVIDLDKRLKEQPDFQIYKLEDIVNSTGGVFPPSRQTSYWLTFVRKGIGEKKIDQQSFSISDYSLFVVPSRTMHSSNYWSTDCSGYAMGFTADFLLNSALSMQCILNRKILKPDVSPLLRLNKSEANVVALIFEDMFKISSGIKAGGYEMLAVKILELLIYCDPFAENHGKSSELKLLHPLVEKFTGLLNKTFNTERGVQFYADALNVHPNYLNFLLKKHNGLSAKENIDRKVMLESKCLLVNRSLRIKEIAHKLGFDDPNNFSTFFQKYAGSSPVTYRTSMA